MENTTAHTDSPRPVSLLVIGAINMDLVARCPHIPAAGETILGSDFTLTPGGKGANAATAAARLLIQQPGNRVALLGAVGHDDNGAALCRNLRDRGVDADGVRVLNGVSTGVALIAVADDGENSIVVVPGANGLVRPIHVQAALAEMAPTTVLMQMEIPLDAVVQAAALGRRAGARVLLDPAPVPVDVPEGLLDNVDVLLPNEGELAALTKMPVESREDVVRAAEALRLCGISIVVVKCGEYGALVVDEHGARPVPTLPVAVVDTTGAGDCFDGAFAVALAEGQPLDHAVRFGTHAAALACTRLGAQSAQPSRTEVERTL